MPRVATSWNPSSANARATSTASALSRSFTLMKTAPLSGSGVPALNCAFANASPKFYADAHHFAGGAHFRAERRIDARELVEREHRRLDEELRHRTSTPARMASARRCKAAREVLQLLAEHQADGDLWRAARRWPC